MQGSFGLRFQLLKIKDLNFLTNKVSNLKNCQLFADKYLVQKSLAIKFNIKLKPILYTNFENISFLKALVIWSCYNIGKQKSADWEQAVTTR